METAAADSFFCRQSIVRHTVVAANHCIVGWHVSVFREVHRPRNTCDIQRRYLVGQCNLVHQITLGLQEMVNKAQPRLTHRNHSLVILHQDAFGQAGRQGQVTHDGRIFNVQAVDCDDEQSGVSDGITRHLGAGDKYPVGVALKISRYAQGIVSRRKVDTSLDTVVNVVTVRIDLLQQVVQVGYIVWIGHKARGIHVNDQHAASTSGGNEIGTGGIQLQVIESILLIGSDIGLRRLLVIECIRYHGGLAGIRFYPQAGTADLAGRCHKLQLGRIDDLHILGRHQDVIEIDPRDHAAWAESASADRNQGAAIETALPRCVAREHQRFHVL